MHLYFIILLFDIFCALLLETHRWCSRVVLCFRLVCRSVFACVSAHVCAIVHPRANVFSDLFAVNLLVYCLCIVIWFVSNVVVIIITSVLFIVTAS